MKTDRSGGLPAVGFYGAGGKDRFDKDAPGLEQRLQPLPILVATDSGQVDFLLHYRSGMERTGPLTGNAVFHSESLDGVPADAQRCSAPSLGFGSRGSAGIGTAT